ncbi:MAG: hypothetical protein JSR47_19785 [Proteobacteria bacterium]|nr:hypothetical protein [Pseudomonadota bacterium]
MKSLPLALLLLAAAVPALAQTPPPADRGQAPSAYYPAPPPLLAPQVDQGGSVTGLTSPLAQDDKKITQTKIDSEAEAQLFAGATKIVWGRYSKIKGAKAGTVSVTKQGGLWTVTGRIDSVAPGTEGDWASINAVVESISANHIAVRGEVAFRLAKVDNGATCKTGGQLHFRRSGKSQTWRLTEGDNPCDGTQERFDLVFDKPAPEKKPAPAPKKG